jgi:NADPH:quinone reductase
MRALRFEKTGSLDALTIQDIPIPIPAPGDVLIQVKAAAINPSDVKNVLGKMHETTLPRTPGRDFSGIVTDGPADLIGKSVFGSGGNLGFGRDGSHAEFLTLPAIAAVPLPPNVTFQQAAGIGVAYMTAWTALVKVAQILPGETLLITGTTGSVGTIAARIAHHFGVKVFGTVRNAASLGRAGDLPVESWINLETSPLPAAIRAATAGRGVDVVFDLLGGPIFEQCLQSLASRGRQVAIASSDPRVTFNLIDFYHNQSQLLGVDSLKISFDEAAEIFHSLSPGLQSGEFPLPKVETYPLDQAPQLYHEIANSTLKGKPVLIP